MNGDIAEWVKRYSALQQQSDAYFNLGKELRRKLDLAEFSLQQMKAELDAYREKAWPRPVDWDATITSLDEETNG